MRPLHATRILDLTRLLPGAVCSMLLRGLGAEIIKIEDPRGGDYARWMPPLHEDGMSLFFHSGNRGKKSVVIDLKSEAGRAILQKLVSGADVLIEGFRPGVMARLGADYETLNALNPRLVYCSLSGWGQTGPLAQVSGHDLNYIASNGLLGAQTDPNTPGAQVADVAGAYVAVMGILAALLKRERTGLGDFLDAALAEAAMPLNYISWIRTCASPEQAAGVSLNGDSACYRVYQSADGEALALAIVEDKFWANFCQAVDQPEWIDQHDRPECQPALIAALTEMFGSKSGAEWQNLLEGRDCCFTRVKAPDQLLDDPHWRARGMLGIDEAGLPWMRSPLRLGGDAMDIEPAPAYGEHTREVLLAHGWDEGEIERLADEGVIRLSG